MSQHITKVVERLLAKAPQWLRHDLSSADTGVRTRAEETLAAMIAAALEEEAGARDRNDSAPLPKV